MWFKQRFARDEPVRARRIGPLTRAARWVRRRKAATAAALIALAASVIVGVMAYRVRQEALRGVRTRR